MLKEMKNIAIMPPDLALWLTLIVSNYLYLEHIFMVPKVFEPMKFYCAVFVNTGISKEKTHTHTNFNNDVV